MTIDNAQLTEMVKWEQGLISPKIFIDDEIYRLELERVFGRSWLFLAHDTMLPDPGDFFATYMGTDPVLVVRQSDGSVKAFLNVCRHRGMKVCRAEDGNAKNFMCTYHGWTYDGSGALVDVPNLNDAYYGELPTANLGLVQVAQVQQYRGLWFGNFDPTAPPLVDALGYMTYYIDAWTEHADGGIEVMPGVIKWTIRGNWKMAAEQFAGDAYHALVTHSSSLGLFGPERPEIPPGRQFGSRFGHGTGFRTNRPLSRFKDDPLGDYSKRKFEEGLARLGESQVDAAGHFTVFPNFSGLGGSANIRVWHPKGPNSFEIWSWTIVEKNAPLEIKKALQESTTFTEGAAGSVEVDDGENWNLIGQILEQGHQSRLVDWNYQMALGHESEDDPQFPGRVTFYNYGETPQRAFYRRWLELMTSSEWPMVEEPPTRVELRPREGASS